MHNRALERTLPSTARRANKLNNMYESSLNVYTRWLVAVLACTILMAASSWLTLLNGKLVKYGFPYPMALGAMGQAFSGLASFICCKVFHVVQSNKQLPPNFYLTKAMPMGLFMAVTLYLNNIAYVFLTISFIAMFKAISPAVMMVGSFIGRLETPTRRLVLSVLLIAFGTLLTSIGEVNFNLLGVFIVILSLVTDTTRLVMTQMLLSGLKFHPVEAMMYIAPSCTLFLLLGSATFELGPMRSSGAFGFILERPLDFLATAFLGFFVNWMNYVVIKLASALTLKILGPVKNAMIVLSSVVFLQETVAPLQLVGYAVSVAAFIWYNTIKMQQANGSKPPNSPKKEEPAYDARLLGAEAGRYAEKHEG